VINSNTHKCKFVDPTYVPSQLELDNMGAGCFIRVKYGENLDWVEVIEIEGDVLTGVLHCELDGSICKVEDDRDKKEIKFKKNQIINLGCDNFCWC